MSSMYDEGVRVAVLRKTTYLLICLGFQARQKGYRYLREAVWVAFADPATLVAVTKCLYPVVARYFGTTDKQIERAIRNAIETAWTHGDPEILRETFGDIYGDGTVRPTNTEVIARLAENVRKDMYGG